MGRAQRKDLPRAGLADTLAIVAEVVVPTLAKGVIIRRPHVVGMAAATGADDRAVRRMQKLRAKYGPGPLLLPIPGRPEAVILAPEDVRRVLEGAPEPFAPASAEKRSALDHFEPAVALATTGAERQKRRAFNERVLSTGARVHPMAGQLLAIVEEEAALILEAAHGDGVLDWKRFFPRWYRMVRRIVLGDGARDDTELTDMLATLRRRANWAFLRPRDKKLREAFHARLTGHLERGQTGSLAARIADLPDKAGTAPSHQVAQWLFAFDPAGMATFRSLALLAAHPAVLEQARKEARNAAGGADLPLLRASYLEALRLWPTTPAILRETTRAVEWPQGIMPAGTGILIYAPYFHRDDERLDYAHTFTPRLWLEGEPSDWPLVPFSMGPAICPAHNLVPMLGSAMLAALIAEYDFTLPEDGPLASVARLPGTLDNYRLRFSVTPLRPAGGAA